MCWSCLVPELVFPLLSESISVWDVVTTLESVTPDAFIAEKSARLGVTSAGSISSHWPLSCFLFHREIKFLHASLKYDISNIIQKSHICYQPIGQEPNISLIGIFKVKIGKER